MAQGGRSKGLLVLLGLVSSGDSESRIGWCCLVSLILSIQSASTPCLNKDPLSAQSTSLPRLSRRGTGPDVPVSATKDGLLSTKKSR